MRHSWTIPASESDLRLDVFLAGELPELTRSQIAKRLKAGGGLVNGKPASVHRFLKKDDVVEFDDERKASDVTDGEPKRASKALQRMEEPRTSNAAPLPLRIIAETKDWMVVDKPAGLVVHPDTMHESGTLVDALLAHDPKIAKVGEDPSRPGIVHRLDMDASGLMVIAKTQDAFDNLKRQFAEHRVEKRYMAIAHGEMTTEEGDIKFRIARSKTKARMAARPAHEEAGKAAWTHYKVLKHLNGLTLLELDILSGRTHQIRAHLFALGHPIIGDILYKTKATGRLTKAPRLMLQSIHLAFHDPSTDELRTFDLPPIPEFDQIVNA